MNRTAALAALTLGATLGFAAPAHAVVTCAGHSATIVGTNGPDDKVGTTGADVVVLLGGSDTFDGRGGADIVCAGDGNDTITVSGRGATVYGGSGSDTVVVQNGSATVHLGNDNDKAISKGANVSATGDGGEDVFAVDAATTGSFNGGDGHDFVNADLAPSALTLNLSTHHASLGGKSFTVSNVSEVVGSHYADHLTGDVYSNILRGSIGRDVLYGGDGNDTLDGGPGNDSLYGQTGFDSLDGGTGYDHGNGGTQPDRCKNVEVRTSC